MSDVLCSCVCHGKWTTIIPNITCNECVERCLKEEAKRIEYHCYRATQPEVEVDYE